MSDYLYFQGSLDSHREKRYWWPLIFEAMHVSSFQFQCPGNFQQKGVYFSGLKHLDEVSCSFKALWDTIYADDDLILVSFWRPGEHFPIQINLELDNHDILQIIVSIEDSQLCIDDIEKSVDYIQMFLNCCYNIVDLCSPLSVQLSWDDDIFPRLNSNLLQIHSANTSEQLCPIHWNGHILQWKQAKVLQGKVVYVIDPFPLWLGNTWHFVHM